MGSQGIIHRSERTTVGKRQNSNVLHQTDKAKSLEVIRNTQAADQESKALNH